MGELVDLGAVEWWFGILAVALPLFAIVIGATLQYRARRPGALAAGIFVGLLGPANWLLWHIYNGIEDHYGLDSVKAMLLNLVLFAALGLIAGAVIRRMNIRRSARIDPLAASPGAGSGTIGPELTTDR